MAAAGAANKKEGETFLAANKAKEGVVTLPDGLQYKDLDPGQRTEADCYRHRRRELQRNVDQRHGIR